MKEERRSGRDRRKRPRRVEDQNKVERLQKLIEASSALATVESVEELLPKLLRMAQEVTFAQASSIMLYDPERETLQFSLALNESKSGILETLKQNIELKKGEGIAGWVAEHLQPVRIDDASTDERFYKQADQKTGFVTRAVLCAPIVHEDELLGVVQVLNPKKRQIFDDEDMELLISFGHLASVALIRRRLMESRIKEERLEIQLDAASEIQRNFLPSEAIEGEDFQIWGQSRPATFVGGDLFAYFPLDDGNWIVALADVSGKGLPAALIMSALTARFYSVATSKIGPAELLRVLNSDMIRLLNGRMFVTIVVASYDPRKSAADIALAGHLPPLKFRVGQVEEVKGIKGLPLGIASDAEYKTTYVTLDPDESLMFLSDGVTEARTEKGSFFEMEGVRKFAANSGSGPRGKALLEAVSAFRDGFEANDDTTLVEIYQK